MGPRLIIVSNRVAVPEPGAKQMAGGLVVAVKAALRNRTGVWFGWSGKIDETETDEPRIVERNHITYAVIDLSKHDFEEYYNGTEFCGRSCTIGSDLQEYTRADHSGYMRVNRRFADKLSGFLREDDVIWVQSKENVATRVLSDEEIRVFWRRIGDPPNSARIGQALRLLTGVRVTEMEGAEISEFEHLNDPGLAVWTIPAARSKNRRPHVAPLSCLATRIVRDLLQRAEESAGASEVRGFLLSSPAGPRKPIDGHALSVAMSRFGNSLFAETAGRAESEGEGRGNKSWAADRPSAHDLRRTLATRLAASGVPAEDISACLNHARRGVTAVHYDHCDRAREKRAALVSWSNQIESLTGGTFHQLSSASPHRRESLDEDNRPAGTSSDS